MGLEAYWVYSIVQRGITVKKFFLMFAAIGASDAIMEHPGVIMGVYEYYGTPAVRVLQVPVLLVLHQRRRDRAPSA